MSSLSARGYGKATEGFDVTNCAAATMVTWLRRAFQQIVILCFANLCKSFPTPRWRKVKSTFTGQTSPYFLGLIPVLNIFDELAGAREIETQAVGLDRLFLRQLDRDLTLHHFTPGHSDGYNCALLIGVWWMWSSVGKEQNTTVFLLESSFCSSFESMSSMYHGVRTLTATLNNA